MVGVVDQQQQLAADEVVDQMAFAGLHQVTRADHLGHRRLYPLAGGQADEVAERDAVVEAVGHHPGDLDGEAGLAHAARPDDGHEPMPLHRGDERADLGPRDRRSWSAARAVDAAGTP
ncbi:MAG: hypothetical protein ACRD2C_14320 [Acidimicrobiales bacterium]